MLKNRTQHKKPINSYNKKQIGLESLLKKGTKKPLSN